MTEISKTILVASLIFAWCNFTFGIEPLAQAKEWPKFDGFDWGMSEREFYEACAKKGLKACDLNPELKEVYVNGAKGELLGRFVGIAPHFRKGDPGFHPSEIDAENLIHLKMTWDLRPGEEKEFCSNLLRVLTKRHGAHRKRKLPNQHSWSSPIDPTKEALSLEWFSYAPLEDPHDKENLRRKPERIIVLLIYSSEEWFEWLSEQDRKRELERAEKAK